MKGLLTFCPTHDFAMPYLAGPLLKGFIEKADSNLRIKCVDLNLEFFALTIPNYANLLQRYRDEVNSARVASAVRASLFAQKQATQAMERFAECYPGHLWSLRNYRSPFDRQDFRLCIQYAMSPSPYDDLYMKFLNRESKPDFFATSITVEDQLQPTLRLLALVRIVWPSVPVILGGNLLNRVCRFIEPHQLANFCDFLLLREGELPLLELLHILEHGGQTTDPRIVEVSRVDKFPPLLELDSLSSGLHTPLIPDFVPDFSDLPVENYFAPRPILPILFSRKCYWARCNFCTIHSAWDPSHRERREEDITSELLASASKYGITNYRIVDESCPPTLFRQVANRLCQQDIEFVFECYGILEKRFLDPDHIRQIARAGCRQIFFGLESSEPATLENMGKQINLTSDIKNLLNRTAKEGIHNYVFTMFGYPSEDLNAQNRTIEYIIGESHIHTAVVSNFVAELESPFSRIHKGKLIHDGLITEKYSQMELNDHMVCARTNGADAALRAQRDIYQRRPDLALTALLNDEARLFLASRFGPDFAKQALRDDPSIKEQLNTVYKIAANERIRRQLT